MTGPKVWFITGASTGFGRFMTELALQKGDNVVATLRRPEVLAEISVEYDTTRLLVLKLDVKKPDDITAAFVKAQEVFGRVDVVFNNAGLAVVSEVESAQDHEDEIRDLFEVNFWGALHVTQAAVRQFREVNNPVGGRLLQVSSMSGIDGVPTAGLYSATKHAIDGLSSALANELDPAWNIKVTIILPGPFRTSVQANYVTLPALPAYTTAVPAVNGRVFMATIDDGPSDDPRKGVEKFYELANLPEPPLRCPVGKLAVESMRKKAASLVAEADAYASWSEGLEIVE
ncbi:NAD-P-binding protein [Obba rivulosa]|uniref:NAD-P-binding protein n=1 Tax=Obba rivulosa TaxID=1052685 RepID=A0A8E2AW58_9APHY|nr:NAD-P-binding protein [Obba rivulosa]